MSAALVESLDTRLGLFRCAEEHAPLLHGEGPFGCPACESTRELLRLRAEVESLTDDLAQMKDALREAESELCDALQKLEGK